MNFFYCESCNIAMDNGDNWASHMVGARHLSKLANAIPMAQLFCHPCRKQLTNLNNFEQHLSSNAHKQCAGPQRAAPAHATQHVVMDYDFDGDDWAVPASPIPQLPRPPTPQPVAAPRPAVPVALVQRPAPVAQRPAPVVAQRPVVQRPAAPVQRPTVPVVTQRLPTTVFHQRPAVPVIVSRPATSIVTTPPPVTRHVVPTWANVAAANLRPMQPTRPITMAARGLLHASPPRRPYAVTQRNAPRTVYPPFQPSVLMTITPTPVFVPQTPIVPALPTASIVDAVYDDSESTCVSSTTPALLILISVVMPSSH